MINQQRLYLITELLQVINQFKQKKASMTICAAVQGSLFNR
jgi:hypothetical protein